jgi:hypothetical protein
MSKKEKSKLSDYKFNSIIVNTNIPKETIQTFLLELAKVIEAEVKDEKL